MVLTFKVGHRSHAEFGDLDGDTDEGGTVNGIGHSTAKGGDGGC